MKYEIRNTAKRPISILCNTGESHHLPPNYVTQFAEAEIINNPLIEKLARQGLIRCNEIKEAKASTSSRKKVVKKVSKSKVTSKAKAK